MSNFTRTHRALFAAVIVCASCGGDDTAPSVVDAGATGGNGHTGGSATGGVGGSNVGGVGGSNVGGAAGAGLPKLTKFDLLSAGKGSRLHEYVCGQAGLPKGCDVCDALGYRGDLECDQSLIAAGLCSGTDADCSARKADFYVAPNGNDNSDGSESAPFATVQRAHDAAQPGTFIYVRGGTYHPTVATTFSKEGTASAPIILQAYPGEQPVIDASGVAEGDVEGGSTPTWVLRGAKHWQLRGPIHLTLGRGAGMSVEGDTRNIDIVRIESSHNGQSASRAGHGFQIVEQEYATAESIRFINCDAHRNANHRTITGEVVADNLYQHGDGWRIKSGRNIELTGCRSFHNLDDGYDLVWAKEPIALYNCWAAYTGRDDAAGSITGTPGFEAAWGEGIKLGYTDDTGRHSATRCLTWKNVHLGFRMDGGPNQIIHASSYQNGRRALGWDLGTQAHVIHNSLDFDSAKPSTIPSTTVSAFNSWDLGTAVTVAADDFVSLDDSGMFGPRTSDGSPPITDFLRLAAGSDLVNAGTDVGLTSSGSAPDLGCFERP